MDRRKIKRLSAQQEQYAPITDGRSEPLQLRLEVDGHLIAFYREDTHEKLPIPSELAQALRQETLARQQAEQQVEQLKKRLRQLGVDPTEL
ncbi:hypothetical protein [Phormidesmis sp. 146-33]